MSRLRTPIYFVGAFTILHGITSVGAYLWSIMRSMEIAYRGVPRTWFDSVLQLLSNILLSPLFALVFHLRFDLLRGIGAYLTVFANSFVWWIISYFRKRRSECPTLRTPSSAN
jgi:hypothetical protein